MHGLPRAHPALESQLAAAGGPSSWTRAGTAAYKAAWQQCNGKLITGAAGTK